MLLMVSTITVAQITVKFQKPAGWTAVSLYTWGPEALGGWPGTALTETNGWYTYTFDASFTGANLIFNNNNSTANEQTVDYPITASSCIKSSATKNADGKYDLTTVACVSGMTIKIQKPAAWTALYLYAYVNGSPIIGGWPGVQLTVDASGWGSYTFDASVTGLNFIINNNSGTQAADTYITASACYTSDGAAITAVDCSATAVENVNVPPLAIYPNPIVDNLNFTGSDKIDKVSVHSLTGQLVLSVSSLSNKSTLDVKSLKSGVYFVSIEYATGKKLTEKIIKL